MKHYGWESLLYETRGLQRSWRFENDAFGRSGTEMRAPLEHIP